MGRPVRAPSQERRRLAEPSPVVDQPDSHLAYDFYGHRPPRRNGIVLPTRWNGAFLWTEPLKQVLYGRRLIGPKLSRHAQVVQLSIDMAQTEHELWIPHVPCHADNGAIGGAIPLDFQPVAAPSSVVAAVRPFRHHALDRWQEGEPLARNVTSAGLLHQLQTRMGVLADKPLEPDSSRREWLIDEAGTADLEHIEGDEDGGLLRCSS